MVYLGMTKAVVVEDDDEIREMIGGFLERVGLTKGSEFELPETLDEARRALGVSDLRVAFVDYDLDHYLGNGERRL